jgi:hypothetical protein
MSLSDWINFQPFEPANDKPANVAKHCESPSASLAELATLSLASTRIENFTNEQLKSSTLVTGTTWRPANPFFIRNFAPFASAAMVDKAYRLAVGYVANGITPEAAMNRAAENIQNDPEYHARVAAWEQQ